MDEINLDEMDKAATRALVARVLLEIILWDLTELLDTEVK